MPNIKSLRHTASEEMSFEIMDDDGRQRMDDGRTTDTYLSYKLTFEPSAQVSGELKSRIEIVCIFDDEDVFLNLTIK